MQIIRHYYDCPETLRHSVIALGNFDGVHQGHQAVIRTACESANAIHVPSAVMTFEPHPAVVLRPATLPFRIEGFRAKAQHIQQLGVNSLFVEHFTSSFSRLSAEDFVADILVKHLAVSHVVIGRDFIFGHNRSGNAELLHELAGRYGFGFTQVRPIVMGDASCSSSNIRLAIKQGDMRLVSTMLGRNYTIEGRVRHGDKRGRAIEVPTANVALHPGLLHPAYGVYAAYVWLEGRRYDAVINIGNRPTFGKTQPLLEAHLLDFNADIYGKRLKVALLEYIRPEKTFNGIEVLKKQIRLDIIEARKILKEIVC